MSVQVAQAETDHYLGIDWDKLGDDELLHTAMALTGLTEAELGEKLKEHTPDWPKQYVNRDTGKVYEPHHEGERQFVYGDTPKHALAKGGEGGGKSVAGIIKCLDRLGAGQHGIMVSPDLPHFKRSLWPEFQRWCPWDQVHDEKTHMGNFTWEPYAPFMIAFKNGAKLWCGGMDEPTAWEGPNINFAFFDEARRKKTAAALKVITGRVRLRGANGEPSQLFITTTPRKHWLHRYFGPLRCKCEDCHSNIEIAIQEGEREVCPLCNSSNIKADDEREAFKRKSLVITLLTKDNVHNLEDDFVEQRALTLTEAEARVLLDAAWEDTEGGQRFLRSMLWWDTCQDKLPVLDKREPLVVALDAATGRASGASDCFGILGVTRHPDPARKANSVAVRYVKAWQARSGQKISFQGTEWNPGPEREFRRLCNEYNVVWVAYDRTQLHDFSMRMRSERIACMKLFDQGMKRSVADTDLLHLIQEKRVAHDGNLLLREHIGNADRKTDDNGKKLRIVKREDSLKIDLAVCLSMAVHECLYLNLG